MIIALAIVHVVALFIQGVYAVPIGNLGQDNNGQLRMYELLDQYYRHKHPQKQSNQNIYPVHVNDLGTEKRGKYSWSVAYGKRDRWIAYGKRSAKQEVKNPQSYNESPESANNEVYDYQTMKRQQAWKTRWGKKRTTAATHPTTKSMKNYEDDRSFEGFFTVNPTIKRQQWTKVPWGKRSF